MMLDGLPLKHFGAILVDPPWHYRTYSKKGRDRCPDAKPFRNAAARHYETMSLDEIAALPVAKIAGDDCVLFLWTTWPMLKDAFRVIAAWDFTYKTCAFDWMKAHAIQIDFFRDDADPLMGNGYWTRSNSEPCLLATRGHPQRLNADVRMGIIEPRREHSRKPDCVHGRIERLVSGPYLELFGRTERPGWTVVGDQVGKFKFKEAAE